jgi:hypothetical protein
MDLGAPAPGAHLARMPVRLYVHLTWTTLQRQPLINAAVASIPNASPQRTQRTQRET